MAIRTTIGEIPNGLALDAQALTGLREQAKNAPGTALKAAATQFEGLFLSMVLKSMREALPQDDPLESESTRAYTGMLDQQLALSLAKKGTGLADVLVKQLSGGMTTSAGATKGAAATTVPAAKEQSAAPPPASGTTPATGKTHASAPTVQEKIQTFLDKMRPHAEAASKATGLPANFMIGQAALETGWGKSEPKAKDGTASHNLFGVKANANWKGATVDAVTTEFVHGKAMRVVQKFRAYASYTEAFADFARMLRGNARYAQVVANGKDAAAYAQGLQQAGYATDPNYAQKLEKVISRTVDRMA